MLLHRNWISTPSNTSGMNRKANREPDLVTRHLWPTSLILLWLNGSKSLEPVLKLTWWALCENLPQSSGSCYSNKLTLMVLEQHIQQNCILLQCFVWELNITATIHVYVVYNHFQPLFCLVNIQDMTAGFQPLGNLLTFYSPTMNTHEPNLRGHRFKVTVYTNWGLNIYLFLQKDDDVFNHIHTALPPMNRDICM